MTKKNYNNMNVRKHKNIEDDSEKSLRYTSLCKRIAKFFKVHKKPQGSIYTLMTTYK